MALKVLPQLLETAQFHIMQNFTEVGLKGLCTQFSNLHNFPNSISTSNIQSALENIYIYIHTYIYLSIKVRD